ncbi:PEF-CTERM sorting domain-containing protein [Methanolobus sediminis]|uniref:PEF-CTERM sorting domain-containing protein n=1 Tax=Methanolobus sediminis TaxID=3072978 RepID=A0AA51UL02_9EURY|nr:PEF-CTERM sorting domain-containing protein [Methanolobus sediminis]WMW25294.1 PEF-CTERM sorting domain-containing protein [Methanolobus sediminis]
MRNKLAILFCLVASLVLATSIGAAAPLAAIDIEKATNGYDADAAPGPEIEVGDPITWTYIVTNIGIEPLDNVIVTDDQGVVVSCPLTTLLPGETMQCTGYGTAVVGQYANLGTVEATDPSGFQVSDSDPSHYNGVEDNEIPEFPTITLPAIAVIGLALFFQRRKA